MVNPIREQHLFLELHGLPVSDDPRIMLRKLFGRFPAEKIVQGPAYDYCGVPEAVFNGLLRASSKGSYYNDHIRDRYPC